jgi:hypothetical protein
MERSGGVTRQWRRVRRIVALVLAIQLAGIGPAAAEGGSGTIELYVDEDTGQVFTKPGPRRARLGTFKRVEDEEKPAAPAAAPSPSAPDAPVPATAPPPGREPAPVEAKAPEAEEKPAVDETFLNEAFHKVLSTK